jgi:hypothetical protein
MHRDGAVLNMVLRIFLRVIAHRYFGVLAPNSPHSAAAVALAPPAKQVVVQTEPAWDLAAQPAPDYEVDQRISW